MDTYFVLSVGTPRWSSEARAEDLLTQSWSTDENGHGGRWLGAYNACIRAVTGTVTFASGTRRRRIVVPCELRPSNLLVLSRMMELNDAILKP